MRIKYKDFENNPLLLLKVVSEYGTCKNENTTCNRQRCPVCIAQAFNKEIESLAEQGAKLIIDLLQQK